MLDQWFWTYCIRVVLVTSAMVALMYGTFVWLKSNRGKSPHHQAKGEFTPPQWVLFLQQRLGMTPLQPSKPPLPQQPSTQKALLPADNVTVQFHGTLTLGQGSHVGVVSIGPKHWLIADSPEGPRILSEHTIPNDREQHPVTQTALEGN